MSQHSSLTLALFFCTAFAFAQAPQNSGIGTITPGSKLEIKAETNDATKSALNVTDNAGSSLLFIRNDGYIHFGDPAQDWKKFIEFNSSSNLFKVNLNTVSNLNYNYGVLKLIGINGGGSQELSFTGIEAKNLTLIRCGNTRLGFGTGNNDAMMQLSTAGNLFLGANADNGTDASARLHIKAETNDASKSALNISDNTGTGLLLVRNDGVVTTKNFTIDGLVISAARPTLQANEDNKLELNGDNTGYTRLWGYGNVQLKSNGFTYMLNAEGAGLMCGYNNTDYLYHSFRNDNLNILAVNHIGFAAGNNRLGIGTSAPTASLDIAASTTSAASFRLRSGSAPTTPNDGDVWYDGSNLKFRKGTTTVDLTAAASLMGTASQIIYFGTDGAATSSANLTYDATNGLFYKGDFNFKGPDNKSVFHFNSATNTLGFFEDASAARILSFTVPGADNNCQITTSIGTQVGLVTHFGLYDCSIQGGALNGNDKAIIKIKNAGINTYAFGTDAEGVISMAVGIEPSSNTNTLQLYSKVRAGAAAGDAGLVIHTGAGTKHLLGDYVGIGTTSPATQLHTTGTVRHDALAGAGSRMVVADASGNLSTQAITGGLTGTANQVTYFGADGNATSSANVKYDGTTTTLKGTDAGTTNYVLKLSNSANAGLLNIRNDGKISMGDGSQSNPLYINTSSAASYTGEKMSFEVGGGAWNYGYNATLNAMTFLTTGSSSGNWVFGTGSSSSPTVKMMYSSTYPGFGVNVGSSVNAVGHFKMGVTGNATDNILLAETSAGVVKFKVQNDGYVSFNADVNASYGKYYFVDNNGAGTTNSLVVKRDYSSATYSSFASFLAANHSMQSGDLTRAFAFTNAASSYDLACIFGELLPSSEGAWHFTTRTGGSQVLGMKIAGSKVGIGGITTPTAALDVAASTTSAASLRLRSGTAPTTPNDGDVWYDGTNLKFRKGAATVDLTAASAGLPTGTSAQTLRHDGTTWVANSALVNNGTQIGIGVASPTAALHLKAGTATANTAPLKLTAGTNLTTAEAGAIEFNGTNLFYTNATPSRITILGNNAGITGGTTLVGGTAASENLALSSTSNATKGKITMGSSAYDELNNRLGVGTATPTAALHLKAGTATANTAPLKLTAGTNLTTPEAGALEFDGTRLFYTTSTPSRISVLGNNLGLTGGTTLVGGTAASENLTLSSSSNATKGKIVMGTSAYDEVNNRLGIGTNAPGTNALVHLKDGHIRSEQTTKPTIAVTTANGITAAAVTTGSSDTKGNITTTGDNTGTNTVLTITFNKAYAVAPIVVISAANATGQICTYFVAATTTTFTLNFKDGVVNATPSFNYMVIE